MNTNKEFIDYCNKCKYLKKDDTCPHLFITHNGKTCGYYIEKDRKTINTTK